MTQFMGADRVEHAVWLVMAKGYSVRVAANRCDVTAEELAVAVREARRQEGEPMPPEVKVQPRAILRIVVDQYKFLVAWMEDQEVPEEYVEPARVQLLDAQRALDEWR